MTFLDLEICFEDQRERENILSTCSPRVLFVTKTNEAKELSKLKTNFLKKIPF